LTTLANRRALADELELVVRAAQGPPRHRRLVPARDAVFESAPALSELAALLRADVPLYARGLALLTRLLTDGAGPLYYSRGDPGALSRALGDARAALFGSAPGSPVAGP
jgi:hypothetical protein